VKNLVDVTRPVDGTQNPQPLNTVRTETDVRVGDPMNPQVGFPLEGPFQNGQRLSNKQGAAARALSPKEAASLRTMASLRLAKARLASGTAEGDEFTVAAGIERDASFSTEAIERELTTLDQVSKAATRKTAKPNLVPRPAGGRQGGASMQSTAATSSADPLVDDASDLFD
jgi:hypothetical protein